MTAVGSRAQLGSNPLSAGEKLTFWTIGHSAAELDDLFRLLTAQGIQVLADVRSSPYSQHAPQANRDLLEAVARQHGLRHVFLGHELGGRPDDAALLLPSGKPDYARMERTEAYRRGIAALEQLARTARVCLLCSEEDPARCHRGLLVSETLVGAGHEVLHLRHDGSVETHAAMVKRRTGGQLALF